MPDERKSILLRINPTLWASLSRWAADDLRSLNAQIEFVLREAVRSRGKGAVGEDAAGGHEPANLPVSKPTPQAEDKP